MGQKKETGEGRGEMDQQDNSIVVMVDSRWVLQEKGDAVSGCRWLLLTKKKEMWKSGLLMPLHLSISLPLLFLSSSLPLAFPHSFTFLQSAVGEVGQVGQYIPRYMHTHT